MRGVGHGTHRKDGADDVHPLRDRFPRRRVEEHRTTSPLVMIVGDARQHSWRASPSCIRFTDVRVKGAGSALLARHATMTVLCFATRSVRRGSEQGKPAQGASQPSPCSSQDEHRSERALQDGEWRPRSTDKRSRFLNLQLCSQGSSVLAGVRHAQGQAGEGRARALGPHPGAKKLVVKMATKDSVPRDGTNDSSAIIALVVMPRRVGPGACCSPRPRMPCYSRDEGVTSC